MPAPDEEISGVVFDIQRYSLGDGPGIRTTVFLKGCPLRCAWCQNPESQRAQPEVAFRADRCLNCGACLQACPQDAIRLGATYRIDRARCDACGRCTEACPSQALFTIGRRYTASELLAEVQRDAVFFATSGGGVTLSGGEPLAQFRFTRAFLHACKKEGINTAIETCGFAPRQHLAALVPLLDTIYFDLKLISSAEHARWTGAGNARILANAKWLVETRAPVTFRVPLVRGVTASDQNVGQIAELLARWGVGQVELCPYQSGWEIKRAWLGDNRGPLGLSAPDSAEMHAVRSAFTERGVSARLAEGER